MKNVMIKKSDCRLRDLTPGRKMAAIGLCEELRGMGGEDGLHPQQSKCLLAGTTVQRKAWKGELRSVPIQRNDQQSVNGYESREHWKKYKKK